MMADRFSLFVRGVKRQLRAAMVPAVFLALVGYFVWSANQGTRGREADTAKRTDLITAQSMLHQAESDITVWERRVAGLRTNRLDRDALDERARAMLNLSDPADITVPYPTGQKLF